MSSGTSESHRESPPEASGGRLRAYLDLTKPRIAALILIVAVGAFYLASPRAVDWIRLAEAVVGISLLAFGIFALNHYAERETDLLMRRTRWRPLPSRRLAPREALVFGAVLTAVAIAGIAVFLGPVSGAVALFTFISYIFVYTPLKRRTMHHTIPGALSGAMPPLLGWASSRGSLDLNAWILFGILFFWQFPHFLALELMYREDYERGGIRVITAPKVSGAAVVVEIVLAMVLLVAVSAAPFFTGLAGSVYLAGSIVLGVGFFAFAVTAAVRKDARSGGRLLRASVSYLPLLFVLLVLNAS